jgi:hypothetical protein
LRQYEHMGKSLSEAALVISGRDVAIVLQAELVSALSKPSQVYLSFVDLFREVASYVRQGGENRRNRYCFPKSRCHQEALG